MKIFFQVNIVFIILFIEPEAKELEKSLGGISSMMLNLSGIDLGIHNIPVKTNKIACPNENEVTDIPSISSSKLINKTCDSSPNEITKQVCI